MAVIAHYWCRFTETTVLFDTVEEAIGVMASAYDRDELYPDRITDEQGDELMDAAQVMDAVQGMQAK